MSIFKDETSSLPEISSEAMAVFEIAEQLLREVHPQNFPIPLKGMRPEQVRRIATHILHLLDEGCQPDSGLIQHFFFSPDTVDTVPTLRTPQDVVEFLRSMNQSSLARLAADAVEACQIGHIPSKDEIVALTNEFLWRMQQEGGETALRVAVALVLLLVFLAQWIDDAGEIPPPADDCRSAAMVGVSIGNKSRHSSESDIRQLTVPSKSSIVECGWQHDLCSSVDERMLHHSTEIGSDNRSHRMAVECISDGRMSFDRGRQEGSSRRLVRLLAEFAIRIIKAVKLEGVSIHRVECVLRKVIGYVVVGLFEEPSDRPEVIDVLTFLKFEQDRWQIEYRSQEQQNQLLSCQQHSECEQGNCDEYLGRRRVGVGG